jgi:hypothetical protein
MKCGWFDISFYGFESCDSGKEALYFDCSFETILVCEDHKCRHNRKATEKELKEYQDYLEKK